MLAGFAGFFGAMALVNVISGAVMRSAASAAYAALMTVVFVLELYSIPHGVYGGAPLHALLLSAYFVCVVAFAFTLLRTLRHDRVAARVTIVLLALNVALVFMEDVVAAWARYYAIDQIALDALIVMMLVLGARAARNERTIALVYLIGVAGPGVGLVLNDLADHYVIRHSLWLIFSFDIGVAWEASFFAYAIALRNQGVAAERDRYERLAHLDGLTGVANRRTFDETLERVWGLARRARVPCAVAMIDIDEFKRFNDSRGHQAGDECLRRVAQVCSAAMRSNSDCFARYGGEEFAAVFFDAELERAVAMAENVRRAVEDAAGITISVGVAARVPQTGDRAEALLLRADQALYEAKRGGRNLVRF